MMIYEPGKEPCRLSQCQKRSILTFLTFTQPKYLNFWRKIAEFFGLIEIKTGFSFKSKWLIFVGQSR